jgi:hypothetical protein
MNHNSNSSDDNDTFTPVVMSVLDLMTIYLVRTIIPLIVRALSNLALPALTEWDSDDEDQLPPDDNDAAAPQPPNDKKDLT